MTQVTGVFSLDVAPGSWVLGPTLRGGETARVRASGVVRWLRPADQTQSTLPPVSNDPAASGAANWLAVDAAGTAYPILSSQGQAILVDCLAGVGGGLLRLPAGNPGSVLALSFGAPGDAFGSYLDPSTGTTVEGDARASVRVRASPGAGVTLTQQTASGAGNVGGGAAASEYSELACAWSRSSTGGGGSVLTIASGSSFTIEVDRVRLIAGPAPTPNGYAYPEGTYPPDFGPVGYGSSYGTAYPHVYDPSAVLSPSAWTGGVLLAPGLPPLSLAMVAAPDGPAPPFASSLLALGPGRDRTLTEADLPAPIRLLLQAGGRARLWFAVDDALAASGDTGSYSLLIERTLTTMPDTLARTSLQAPRFGVQTSPKTRAAATFMLACIANNGLRFKPETTSSKQTVAGIGHTVGQTTVSHSSTAEVALTLDFVDSFRVVRDALAAHYRVTTLATGVYRHELVASVYRQVPPARKTVEMVGEPDDPVSLVLDVIFNGLKIQCDPGKLASCTSEALGGKIDYGTKTTPIVPTAGRNDVQVLSFVGVPTGGQIVLLDGSSPSGAITPTMTASQVQTAVRTLPNRSADVVAGSAGGPYTITSTLGTFRPLLTADYTALDYTSTLTGGTDPTATVAHQTRGGFDMGILDQVTDAQAWFLRLADSWDAIENGGAGLTLGTNWSTDITIAPRSKREWIQKGAGVFNYGLRKPDDLTDTAKLSMGLDSVARGYLIDAQNDARKCMRIQADGDEIGSTGFRRSIAIDMDGQMTWDDHTDVENAKSIDLTFEAHYNLDTGHMLRVSWVNEKDGSYYGL